MQVALSDLAAAILTPDSSPTAGQARLKKRTNVVVVRGSGPDSWSLLAVAASLSAARVVVSTHGGQGMNMVFAPPGAVFVEIVPGVQTRW